MAEFLLKLMFDIVNMGRETQAAYSCDTDLVTSCRTLVERLFMTFLFMKIMKSLGYAIYCMSKRFSLIFFETQQARYLFEVSRQLKTTVGSLST